ncbi:hypothetical protein ACLI4Y_00145 [Natrialbaceae archaeon A-CW3]
MRLAHVTALEDFGTRSLLVHGLMTLTFANAILIGLFLEGQVAVVSFVALLNLTAGLWVAHSIHSLGDATGDGSYRGILNELLENDDGESEGFDTGRFGRLVTLIAAVTAIALLTSAQVLSGAVLSLAVVAVGAIAIVTAIVGFLIALGAAYDDAQRQTQDAIDQFSDTSDPDL